MAITEMTTAGPIPLGERPRFLVDVNVGRLARWLRILGYDARYIPHAEDGHLVEEGLREGRVLLTRDRHLLDRRVVTSGRLRAILIQHDDVMEQLRQVAGELGLDRGEALSLCVVDSAPLRPRSKDSLRGVVPPYVFWTQDEFMECPACGKVYWRGTHWERMRQRLAGALQDARRGEP